MEKFAPPRSKTARFGSAFDRRGKTGPRSEILSAERDDAHEPFVSIEDRQPPDLFLHHQLLGVVRVLILETIHDFRRHAVADESGFRIAAFSHGAHGQVAIGEHSDQPFAIADRQRAHVKVAHFPRRFVERTVRTDYFYFFGLMSFSFILF